jgi:multisubunit Na+/H+ antiporter MnhB subunit
MDQTSFAATSSSSARLDSGGAGAGGGLTSTMKHCAAKINQWLPQNNWITWLLLGTSVLVIVVISVNIDYYRRTANLSGVTAEATTKSVGTAAITLDIFVLVFGIGVAIVAAVAIGERERLRRERKSSSQ